MSNEGSSPPSPHYSAPEGKGKGWRGKSNSLRAKILATAFAVPATARDEIQNRRRSSVTTAGNDVKQ